MSILRDSVISQFRKGGCLRLLAPLAATDEHPNGTRGSVFDKSLQSDNEPLVPSPFFSVTVALEVSLVQGSAFCSQELCT